MGWQQAHGCEGLGCAALFLVSLLLVHAAGAQQGFVSINCCATSNTTEQGTGITWTSDDHILSPGAGECRDVSTVNTTYGGGNASARVFTSDGGGGGKWCYDLPTVDGRTYLVRATFLGGPRLRPSSENSSFDFSICSTTISRVESSADALQVEGVFGATGRLTSICMVNHNGGVAHISKIELRPLADDDYPEGEQPVVLKLVARVDAGNRDPGQIYRYPADPSDRIWTADTSSAGGRTVGSSQATLRGSNTSVPLEVLRTAAAESTKLVFLHPGLAASDQRYLVILHLFEIDAGVRTGQRAIDIYINGARVQTAFDILGNGNTTNYRAVRLWANATGSLNISLVKAADAAAAAAFGPICNAYEIFQAYRRAAETAKRDGEAAREVREELLVENPGHGVVGRWYGDPCAPSPPWEGVVCEERGTTGNSTLVITKLNLSSEGLRGSLPSTIGKLTHLRELDLQNNDFTGVIPKSWESLTHLLKLSIGCNPQLETLVPPGFSNHSELKTDYGNCSLHPSSMQPIRRNIFIGSVAGGTAVFTLAVGFFFNCFYKRTQHTDEKDQKVNMKNANFLIPLNDTQISNPVIQQFSLAFARDMTSDYKTIIAEGGFGVVYHGILHDGQEVAVKVRSATSIQGTREFENEVKFLSAIHHDNLVPLIGYCRENDQQILVYPFMSNGSLQDRLYGEAAKRKALDWPTRLSIALGTARGLMYLHNFEGRCIIHRDVKSGNILLDDSMSAKVADLGFSKYAPQEGDSGTSLEVRGTAGYLDPEYYSTQRLSNKSDVFSFGVVLLEIISGREPLKTHGPRSEWSLVEWAKAYIMESRVDEIVDPSIRSGYHAEAMWRVAEVASSCVESFSINRPSMEDIVRELEDALIIENNASEYMRSIESFGGSNRFLSVERKTTLAPIPSPADELSPTPTVCQIAAPPRPR